MAPYKCSYIHQDIQLTCISLSRNPISYAENYRSGWSLLIESHTLDIARRGLLFRRACHSDWRSVHHGRIMVGFYSHPRAWWAIRWSGMRRNTRPWVSLGHWIDIWYSDRRLYKAMNSRSAPRNSTCMLALIPLIACIPAQCTLLECRTTSAGLVLSH